MNVITHTTDEEEKSIGCLAALIEMAFLEDKGATGLVEVLKVFFTEIGPHWCSSAIALLEVHGGNLISKGQLCSHDGAAQWVWRLFRD